MKIKVIVFDIGGTLMEYAGMPLSWVDYYKAGFMHVNEKYCLSLDKTAIDSSVVILKSYNPRLNYRETEYVPEIIFEHATKHWHADISIDKIISTFFHGLNLTPVYYEDTIPVITDLKKNGYLITTLTDLPTAMPDEMFKKDISDLLQYFDLYVSSQTCGYRKPNPSGLHYIAKEFNVRTDELLFVGDEEKDKKTAENAKCNFLMINRNEHRTLLDISKELPLIDS